jgi:hypothetical protein
MTMPSEVTMIITERAYVRNGTRLEHKRKIS